MQVADCYQYNAQRGAPVVKNCRLLRVGVQSLCLNPLNASASSISCAGSWFDTR